MFLTYVAWTYQWSPLIAIINGKQEPVYTVRIVFDPFACLCELSLVHCQSAIDMIRSNSVGWYATSLSLFDLFIWCYVASAVAIKQAGSNKKNRSGTCSIYNIFQYLVTSLTFLYTIEEISMGFSNSIGLGWILLVILKW